MCTYDWNHGHKSYLCFFSMENTHNNIVVQKMSMLHQNYILANESESKREPSQMWVHSLSQTRIKQCGWWSHSEYWRKKKKKKEERHWNWCNPNKAILLKEGLNEWWNAKKWWCKHLNHSIKDHIICQRTIRVFASTNVLSIIQTLHYYQPFFKTYHSFAIYFWVFATLEVTIGFPFFSLWYKNLFSFPWKLGF